MYARRGVLAIHFNDRDNTLTGSSKFTYNAYNHSNKVVNITKVYPQVVASIMKLPTFSIN